MTVETITLGCRLNFAESELLKRTTTGNVTIINSCAVTAEAERQTRQAIRRARRDRPDARIIVTGCAAQLSPDAYRAMPEVDVVEIRDLTAPLTVAAGYRGRVRSFVAVQTGCDHRCTFCIIWQARGPSRSLPYEAVRDAVIRELDGGAREIVLTGVDLTSYKPSFGALCQRLLADLPALPRLRLSSLDSIEIDGALMELIAAHVFPFSPRPDTPAARMPQCERETIKARAARLREHAVARRSAWLDSLVGSTLSVLIENRERGHSDQFAPLYIAGSARGDAGLAYITGRTPDHLIGIFA